MAGDRASAAVPLALLAVEPGTAAEQQRDSIAATSAASPNGAATALRAALP
jgi:hypothetical protein